jgi:DNA-binding CsgD family transcriptional regulator
MIISVLGPALRGLERCKTVADLSGVAVDTMKGVFGATIGAAILLGSSCRGTRGALGMRDADLEEYERIWQPRDFMAQELRERAVPVHNWQVITPERLRRDPTYVHFARRLGAWHVMMAPVYGPKGGLDGLFILSRGVRERPHDCRDLALAGAFSGFFAATLARVHGGHSAPGESLDVGDLTRRELQIAQRVASGLSNVEVALELGVARETVKQALARVYAKLDVSGRAQMAATLASRGWLGDPLGRPDSQYRPPPRQGPN